MVSELNNKFYEEKALRLVKSANIFATSSTISVINKVPLIERYFKMYVLSTESWDFYITIASVGTAFIAIADYVPKEKIEDICNLIGEELIKFHPKGYIALENLIGLLHNYCDAAIPFHNAMANWLSINLLQKDQPLEEDIEAFSIVGKLIQYEFGGWFKKK